MVCGLWFVDFRVTGLRLSDGAFVHYDMLQEDEQFVDDLNQKINQTNIATRNPIYMPADPGACDAAAAAAAASGATATAPTAGVGTDAAAGGDDPHHQQQQQQQDEAPTSGPFRLVLNPCCLANKSLFLSDLAFIKLMDALEKEAHARGGSEMSVTPDDAARIAAHDLNLGLHAIICKHVHAVRSHSCCCCC